MMRTTILALAMIAGLAQAATLPAADFAGSASCSCSQTSGVTCGCDGSDPCACGRGGHCGCGLFGHKCGCPIDGLSRWANCGCNGSYNYPVPPLYTYHWPGMYKQVRMTDYHSPWRFPPLRRYEDEPLPTIEEPAAQGTSGPVLLRPASLQKVSIRPGTAR